MQTLFERIGGETAFATLVQEFYRGVSEDELLKPMYPPEDMAGAERRLKMFLEQYWGGPKSYQEERGHPRLRMRHSVFPIGPKARDAWLAHMLKAVKSLELSQADEAELWDHLERAARAMLNRFDN